MHRPLDRLLAVLKHPASAQGLNESAWLELVTTARALNLLGLLGERMAVAQVEVLPRAHRHLEGARQLSARQRLSVGWEVRCLQNALGKLGVPVLLLKGAAYATLGHAVSRGRLFGDIDIMVPRHALPEVESSMRLAGWVTAKSDLYDQRYYREWMHELPPMMSVRRGTILDIHHTILPLTARNSPDPGQIIARAQTVPGFGCIATPCAEDLVVHSIVHLTHEGELHNGLRDLADIDGLISDFAQDEGFWHRLVSVAAGNDLAQPVWLGLMLVREFFDTPVPKAVLDALGGPQDVHRLPRLLSALYLRAIPSHAEQETSVTDAMARAGIYIRAHWLRMPFPLLVQHLSRKAWRSLVKKDNPAESG